jgi:hypothetical protein
VGSLNHVNETAAEVSKRHGGTGLVPVEDKDGQEGLAAARLGHSICTPTSPTTILWTATDSTHIQGGRLFLGQPIPAETATRLATAGGLTKGPSQVPSTCNGSAASACSTSPVI